MVERPGYFTTEEEYYEDLIKRRRREESVLKREEGEYTEKIPETVVRKQRMAMPKPEELKIQPLRLKKPEIVGNLFDRLHFLKTRIAELQETIKQREMVHKDIIKDIELDIEDKRDMANRVADIDEKRNLMLDISILRRERRTENLQFWRDITELKHELRELLEKYQTEMNIVSLFKDVKAV